MRRRELLTFLASMPFFGLIERVASGADRGSLAAGRSPEPRRCTIDWTRLAGVEPSPNGRFRLRTLPDPGRNE